MSKRNKNCIPVKRKHCMQSSKLQGKFLFVQFKKTFFYLAKNPGVFYFIGKPEPLLSYNQQHFDIPVKKVAGRFGRGRGWG